MRRAACDAMSDFDHKMGLEESMTVLGPAS